MEKEVHTASTVFYSGICMCWINLIVQVIIPTSNGGGIACAEIVSALGLALVLQSLQLIMPGNKTLQGWCPIPIHTWFLLNPSQKESSQTIYQITN